MGKTEHWQWALETEVTLRKASPQDYPTRDMIPNMPAGPNSKIHISEFMVEVNICFLDKQKWNALVCFSVEINLNKPS